MVKFAFLLQIVALLLQLADCRKLRQALQGEETSSASFQSTSRDCLKFGVKCHRTFPEDFSTIDEQNGLQSTTRPEEQLAIDRTYEPSPPKRTILSGSSSSIAAATTGDTRSDSISRQLSEDDFEETMRTDYAPVRRKPPINNEVPFFTRRTP